MIADEPQSFATAVVELRVAGRELVEYAYEWREQYPAWEQIWGTD